uniref:uncharacterized protein n=1 Tax=Pristiophorus japonicus TaxID=55135 RepID=UPI00398F4922
MWLWWLPTLILSFTGSFASIKLPEPNWVLFDSVNFNNTLRWSQKGPRETMYDVEYLIYGEKIWKNKPECHHITAHYCDLTNEIAQENNWYYARVMAVSKNTNSTWALSERFCPLDKSDYVPLSAVIGAPAVKYTAGVRSMSIWVDLPRVPPKEGVQRSIEDIFAVIEYEVQLNKSLTNKMVFYALNKSGYLKIKSLEPHTKYCASVELRLRKEIFSKKSQPAHFCIQTLQERTLTVILLTAFVLFGAIITGIFCCVAYSYIKHHRTLPQSLNLDQILSHKRALLKQSSPALQLVTGYKKKDAFQFEQVLRMDGVDLLKCDSNDTEEIIKANELTLATQLGTYAPQCSTRVPQTRLQSANDCEVQSNSSFRPIDRCSSPYCPQATDGLPNTRCTSRNRSRALTQNYGIILHLTSLNSTKLNTDPKLDTLYRAQKVPVNALEIVSEGLLSNNGDLMLQHGLGLEIQKLKLEEDKLTPLAPFLSLPGDKQQTRQPNWEIQPRETPLLLSLKDENQMHLSLFQYGQQMESQSLLSLQSERVDDQPTEEVSATEVLQTDLQVGQLVKAGPLLVTEEFTGLLRVKLGWEGGCERQLLTFHSSREGQQSDASFLQTLQANASMETGKLLEDWEIQVHMGE